MAGLSRKIHKNEQIICERCNLLIKKSHRFLECDKCTNKLHDLCTRLDKREFEFLFKNKYKFFTCHLCKDGEERMKKTEIHALKTTLKKLDELTDMQEAIHLISKKYDEILKAEDESKGRLNEVQEENRSLKKEIIDLKSSVKLLNDDRVKNDCIISGLQVADGVTAVDSVLALAQSVGIDMVPESVDDAYFLRKKNRSEDEKRVVVKFSNKSSKDKLMSAIPKLKENKVSIEINDFLGKETLNLFKYARRALKEVGYRYVFAKDGKVFYKRSENSKPELLKCELDVDQLLFSGTTTTHTGTPRSIANNAAAEHHDNDGAKKSTLSDLNTVIRIPTERDAIEYNMNHKKRGLAMIFNHATFENSELPYRKGTHNDCEKLIKSFESLDFAVNTHNDCKLHDLRKHMKKAASADHTEHDCIAIVILTHGKHGHLCAKDAMYTLDSILRYFSADNCPTLAGKPKLFFIQACRGEGLDPGVNVRSTETDSGDMSSEISYGIPVHADFLIAYSTKAGFISWRNPEKGSWYIESLVQEFNENGRQYDLQTLLTFVNRRVSNNYLSFVPDTPKDKKKQISAYTSMLTRILRFTAKTENT